MSDAEDLATVAGVGGEVLPVEVMAARLRALHGTSGALARVWAGARAARDRKDRVALRRCIHLLDAVAGLRG